MRGEARVLGKTSLRVGFINTLKSKVLLACSAALFSLNVSAADVAYTDGDAAAGKAKAETCVMCHGANGDSTIATFPKIAGQHAKYAFKQLKDMKSGLRPVDEMAAIIADLNDQDFADLAAYYAEQTSSVGAVDPSLKDLGEAIYRGGIADRAVPACIACHGPKADGMAAAGFPALSGQHPGYTASQLAAFRASARGDEQSEHRVNDGDSMIMRAAVKRMTDAEIKAVSSYISGLH